MSNHRRTNRYLAGALCSLACAAGCFGTKAPLEYLGKEPLRYYQAQATRIDEPCAAGGPCSLAVATDEPRTLRDRRQDDVWNMPLAEAIHLALQNATVIRSNATFRSAGNPILANGTAAATILDPSIQESAVVGQQGVEAALSSFDADFTSSMTWGRDERVQNSPFSPAGFGVVLPTVAQETAAFRAGLGKRFANGGSFDVTHDMNYLGVPPGLFPFPSAYSGNVALGYRQPLWAGAGTEFTRISGPINEQTELTRNLVGEGVVLARINENISLDDFEAQVRNLVLDVEFVYWDLYLQYRLYNAAVVARNRTLETWRRLEQTDRIGAGGIRAPFDLIQARDQYYATRSAAEEALAAVYATETRLRRLLALPVNDGLVIRPSDEPLTAPFEADWYASLAESLVERVELRKQKWTIKSLELQLRAARNLVNPRLDFVSGYNVNAFGDQLLGYGSDDDSVNSPQGLRYAYESLTQGNQTGWTLGFELSMPLGFRHAHTQVRNYELQLVKARDVLAAQELDISHELATSFQNLAEHYQRASTNYNRRVAAVERADKLERFNEAGGDESFPDSISEQLRAQVSAAQSERDYFLSLVEYNKAIADLQYRKGTLLEFNKVFLTEGGWDPAAYALARRRAESRSNAIDASDLLHSEPMPFASPVPTHGLVLGPVGYRTDGPDGPHDLIPLPAPEGLDAIPVGPEDNVPAGPTPAPTPAPAPAPAPATTPIPVPGNAATLPRNDSAPHLPVIERTPQPQPEPETPEPRIAQSPATRSVLHPVDLPGVLAKSRSPNRPALRSDPIPASPPSSFDERPIQTANYARHPVESRREIQRVAAERPALPQRTEPATKNGPNAKEDSDSKFMPWWR